MVWEKAARVGKKDVMVLSVWRLFGGRKYLLSDGLSDGGPGISTWRYGVHRILDVKVFQGKAASRQGKVRPVILDIP